MKKALSISLLFVIITATTYAQKINMGLNLVKGNTYYLTNVTKMVSTMHLPSGVQDSSTTTTSSKISFKVIAIKDTTFVMDVKYDSIRSQTDVPGFSIEMSSDGKDTINPISPILANLTHNSFTIILSNKGRVLAVDHFDKLLSGMFEGATKVTQATETEQAQLKNQMVQLFGPKALKGNIESCTAIFPNGKVAKNDKWLINRSLGSIMSIKTKANYTLQDITENTLVIHGDEVIEPEDANDYNQLIGVKLKYTINGTSTSDIKVDKKSGWVIESKTVQLMKGQIDTKDKEPPGDITLPITARVDQIITGK